MALHVAVADTGLGVPAEKLQVIFQPFEQVDASTRRKYGGTGLGLAISSRLVEMMGGRMGIDSEPGRGTTVHFSAVFGVAAAEPGRGPLPGVAAGPPVLVADDHAATRESLAEGPGGLGPAADDRRLRRRPSRPCSGARPRRRAVFPGPGRPPHARAGRAGGAARSDRGRRRPGWVGHPPVEPRRTPPPTPPAPHRLGIAAIVLKPVKLADLAPGPRHRSWASSGGGDAPRPPAPPAVGGGPLRILLAEDNPINQKLALALLLSRGHCVEPVGNGREAVTAHEDRSFDLILMDVEMPEMDGLEATAAIRC